VRPNATVVTKNFKKTWDWNEVIRIIEHRLGTMRKVENLKERTEWKTVSTKPKLVTQKINVLIKTDIILCTVKNLRPTNAF
jgi:hypothetical protein